MKHQSRFLEVATLGVARKGGWYTRAVKNGDTIALLTN